ncbi:hypothetical protein N0B40_13755 [Chryseobacterium oranimense]|uniref:hypothetical protein n=1 Tax=Chryseobacterium oranimense TaxID=421058 RepID=UPI0021AECA8C|nr:hypothetical protein [Chryseobacterium oranimense]UWX59470.1 hypothetical protein N0B40_13755 [Chryseobacterium oranimense]
MDNKKTLYSEKEKAFNEKFRLKIEGWKALNNQILMDNGLSDSGLFFILINNGTPTIHFDNNIPESIQSELKLIFHDSLI